MQAHICDSYQLHGGYACKWDAAHVKGKPDLVCAFPGYGAHFIEVKHRPEISVDELGAIKNPLEPKQVSEARKITKGGGVVMGGLVVGGAASVASAAFALFNPLSEVWYLNDGYWVRWHSKTKFCVPEALAKSNQWRQQND